MNNYELMMILNPVSAEEDVRTLTAKYRDMVTAAGGSIVNEEAMGMRQLAYPIQKKTTGIYHLLEFTGPGELIGQMEVQFHRDDAIMRHMVTRLDKFAVEYNEKRRKGEIGKKQKAFVEDMQADMASAASAAPSKTQED
jgi:small subunit ribosomal protein S6